MMNHKIIEIIGPPGVGKTTVYDALCKTWRPASEWIYQDALLTAKPQFSDFGKWVEYRFRKLTGKKTGKSIPVEYGLRFVRDHGELANFYWNHLSDTQTYTKGQIDKRFRSAYFLFSDFCRYQAIWESNPGKPCIINEGLLQRSFFIHPDERVMQERINAYLPLLPLPHGIISINTPGKSIILERLRSRSKVIAPHLGKDNNELLADIERWQYLLHLILAKMKSLHVPVYYVDGEKPVAENVLFIKNIFRQQ